MLLSLIVTCTTACSDEPTRLLELVPIGSVVAPRNLKPGAATWSGGHGHADLVENKIIHARLVFSCRASSTYVETRKELIQRLDIQRRDGTYWINEQIGEHRWTIVDTKTGFPRWHAYADIEGGFAYVMLSDLFTKELMRRFLGSIRLGLCNE